MVQRSPRRSRDRFVPRLAPHFKAVRLDLRYCEELRRWDKLNFYHEHLVNPEPRCDGWFTPRFCDRP